MKDLEIYGFRINPYDPCVEIKMINNNHITVVCHKNDFRVSHVNIFEIKNSAGYMSIIYGVLTVHRGKVRGYLGMDLKYSYQGKLKESIIK